MSSKSGPDEAAPGEVSRTPQDPPKVLVCISGSDLWDRDYPDIQCLINGLLPEASCSFNAGPSGVRKTWFELELAIAVVTGHAALERFNVSRPGPVMMIMGEDSLKAIRKRMQMLAKGKDLKAADLKGLFFIEASGVLSSVGKCKELADLCEKYRPRLIVLDPFVRMHTCDENSAQEIQPILNYLRELSRRFSVSILVTHHLKKNREDGVGRKMELMRGSGDIGAWADTVLILSRHGEAAAAPTEVTIAKQRDMIEHPPFAFTLEIGGPEDDPIARLNYQELGDAARQKVEITKEQILGMLRKMPNGMLKNDLLDGLRGNTSQKRQALSQLESAQQVTVESKIRKARDGKDRQQKVVHLAFPTAAHAARQGLAEVACPSTPTPASPFSEAGVYGLEVSAEDPPRQGLAWNGAGAESSEHDAVPRGPI